MSKNLDDIIKFIYEDNPDSAIANWPEDAQEQSILLAMMIARNSREIKKLPRLWLLAILAMAIGTAALTYTLGLDLVISSLSAIIVGITTYTLKMI